jgi:anti-sigma regulatory factor (Ser/Thr protein kinase)
MWRLNINDMAITEHVRLAASLKNIPRFREVATRACTRAGASADARMGLELAVDEVCTNIIQHGYDPDRQGEISLTIELDTDEARITVVDSGRPFSPDEAAEPDLEAPWDERPVGGLGWHLVRSVVDEIHYRRDGSENLLTLVKRLDGGSGANREQE